jgi:hypothetical protein
MKKLFLMFALLPLFLFNNCSDKDNLTYIEPSETEIVAKKLQELIDEKNIKFANVYIFNIQENEWDKLSACDGLEVSDPYIIVCGTYYHLSKLVKFEIGSGLELYFKY